jgi:hypothetical protein
MRRRSLLVLIGLTIVGCASIQNAPAQDAVWAAYNQCRTEGRVPANVRLIRVEPNGHAWYQTYSSSYGGADFERCMTEKTGASATTNGGPELSETTSPRACPSGEKWDGASWRCVRAGNACPSGEYRSSLEETCDASPRAPRPGRVGYPVVGRCKAIGRGSPGT